MDAAVTALTPANEAALLAEATPGQPTGPLARLQALPPRKRALLAIGTAGLAAVLVVLTLWSRHVPMAPLFAQVLQNNELGVIVEQLNKMGESHEIGRGGGLIMVPAERVNALRMQLAVLGLPRSAPTGFEAMEKSSFGQSQLQERTHLQRALATQLEQQIATISAVQSVKVMVALTQQTGFYREQDKPSASVALTLLPGRTLDRSQIAGIVNMTSTAVPGLNAKAVTITDQDGNWLTQPDSELRSDLTAQQRAHLRETETRLLKRVNEILEPVLGADNLRATVTAELDFNQVESTSEAFSPNQGADARASVRSQQSLEAGNVNQLLPTGVPGAASNQAPTPAAAPATANPAAPLQAAQAGQNGVGGSGARRENRINYEIDKTVETKRLATGEIRRVNVAVLVNHRTTLDPKTSKPNSAPLPPEEMEKLTALVQEAVGFKKERGDSVRVVNIPFRAEPKVEPEATPVWQQPWLIDLLRAGGLPAALTLVALMLLLGVVRPALRPDAPPAPPAPEPSTLDAVVDDTEALPGPTQAELLALEAPKVEKQLIDARALAKENPQAVANMMRAWIDGES
ncbi:MAG: flagellar M-ring protein FliF [Burkholderiales bacterium RIFCSPHIGHO2_12_FULL_69_20]|nr:MAG: flagellar M-ring protein FliF [Burkholderiales bacterium RIFCSPHIGHO2_12_FULL_69_20]